MCTVDDTEGASTYSAWSGLYDAKDPKKDIVKVNGEPKLVWEIARDMLLKSIFDVGICFGLSLEQELVSRGVTMLKEVSGDTKERMAEPLVLSAGLSFFARNQIDLAGPLMQRLCDPTFTDPQHRGRVLELLAAVRLFEKPNRLQQLTDWPADLHLPSHQPRGILVNVALTDPRVSFETLTTIPKANKGYFIALPEVQAGPDLVMPGCVFSFKTTSTRGSVS